MNRTTTRPSRITTTLATLVLCLVTTVAVADFERFIGRYSGSAEVEDDGASNRRDMSVVVEPAGDGFRVNWKSVTRKTDGRVKEKEYSIGFLPTARDGIYSSAMGVNLFGNPTPLDPMKGDPYVWSRITGDTLTVFLIINRQKRRLRNARIQPHAGGWRLGFGISKNKKRGEVEEY